MFAPLIIKKISSSVPAKTSSEVWTMTQYVLLGGKFWSQIGDALENPSAELESHIEQRKIWPFS